MSRIFDRQRAIELRREGKTYSEIKSELKVSKSTLSEWLRAYPLNDAQVSRLALNRIHNREVAIEKTRSTKQQRRDKRLQLVYEAEREYWRKLSIREVELAGLFLYWGEGNKSLKGSLSINNTDPAVMKFALFWMVHGLKIPRKKIKVYLHLYKDMNIEEEIGYWSKILLMPRTQFLKPYIKDSLRAKITHKGFGHGTCGLVVHNSKLKEKVILGIKAISDQFSHTL